VQEAAHAGEEFILLFCGILSMNGQWRLRGGVQASGSVLRGYETCVPRQAVASLLSGGLRCLPGTTDDRRNIEQFLHYRQESGAVPVIRVRYVRRAFESRSADDVRVTFDRRLSFNVTREEEVGLNGLGWQPLRGDLVVLEDDLVQASLATAAAEASRLRAELAAAEGRIVVESAVQEAEHLAEARR